MGVKIGFYIGVTATIYISSRHGAFVAFIKLGRAEGN